MQLLAYTPAEISPKKATEVIHEEPEEVMIVHERYSMIKEKEEMKKVYLTKKFLGIVVNDPQDPGSFIESFIDSFVEQNNNNDVNEADENSKPIYQISLK